MKTSLILLCAVLLTGCNSLPDLPDWTPTNSPPVVVPEPTPQPAAERRMILWQVGMDQRPYFQSNDFALNEIGGAYLVAGMTTLDTAKVVQVTAQPRRNPATSGTFNRQVAGIPQGTVLHIVCSKRTYHFGIGNPNETTKPRYSEE